jgi:centromere/kinetochore protein ZW10
MMPIISTRIEEEWLDRSVPVSLDSLDDYQASLSHVDDFADQLKLLDWPGSDTFGSWARKAPTTWLTKQKETALDLTRNHLALGMSLHPEIFASSSSCLL